MLDMEWHCGNETCWSKTLRRWTDHRNAYLYTCMGAREPSSFQNKSQILPPLSNQRKVNKRNTASLSRNSRTFHRGFPELSGHIKTWKMLNQLLLVLQTLASPYAWLTIHSSHTSCWTSPISRRYYSMETSTVETELSRSYFKLPVYQFEWGLLENTHSHTNTHTHTKKRVKSTVSMKTNVC